MRVASARAKCGVTELQEPRQGGEGANACGAHATRCAGWPRSGRNVDPLDSKPCARILRARAAPYFEVGGSSPRRSKSRSGRDFVPHFDLDFVEPAIHREVLVAVVHHDRSPIPPDRSGECDLAFCNGSDPRAVFALKLKPGTVAFRSAGSRDPGCAPATASDLAVPPCRLVRTMPRRPAGLRATPPP